MRDAPRIDFLPVGAFQENAYLVADVQQGRGVLVDPGDEGERLVRMVEEANVVLDAIWLTHAHLDHIGGIAAVKRRFDVPVFLHPADLPLYERADRQAAAYGLPFEQPAAPDRELAEGDRLTVGRFTFEVLHTPGHAPGHCVFVGHDVMLGGDLLFAGSIGRTDLPLSDPRAMQRSLERITGLDDAVAVHPGHGPSTTIGAERRSNPFLSGAARLISR